MRAHIESIEQKLQLSASYWVYCKGLNVDSEDIEKLLNEPRDKIIHDMELLIVDALDNSPIYEKKVARLEPFELFDPDFLILAIMVLGELESKGSLALFLEILDKGPYWLYYWLSDEYFDMLWEPFVRVCINQLAQIEKCIKDPKTSYLARSIIGKALVQIALNYPSLKQEVIGILTRQIKHYINLRDLQSEEDRLHMGMLVWNLADLGNTENLPLVREVFGYNLMEEDVLGNLSVTEKIFFRNKKNSSIKIFKKIMPLIDRHKWYWEQTKKEYPRRFFDINGNYDISLS